MNVLFMWLLSAKIQISHKEPGMCRMLSAEELILHSDPGSQHTSQIFEKRAVTDLPDEIESETLYLALVTADRRTLQIALLKMQGYSTKGIAPSVHLTTGAVCAGLSHLRKKLWKILS